MKHITAGIVAHVDAGKTTLSEALLYQTGAKRTLGRVDQRSTLLDWEPMEQRRGITIFSHQAQLSTDKLALTLLDTPGHVDFASQTEQVLSVLDAAVLVVAAGARLPGYTLTLWRLLERYQVPTIIFVNKMDVTSIDKPAMLGVLQQAFGDGVIAFDGDREARDEAVALRDDALLDQYLEGTPVTEAAITELVAKRRVVPAYFGSALKLTGVDALIDGLERWLTPKPTADEFGMRVFKVSHTEKGERLTWVRVTGGQLAPKMTLPDGQKVNQMRVYQGERFRVVPSLTAGQVGALPGLQNTKPGQAFGAATPALQPQLQPVLTYALDPKQADLHVCLAALRELEEEDPQLAVDWSEQLQEVRVQLMGTVALEILQQRLLERFDLDVDFDAGGIIYRETITAPVEGVGHFEPLRHYAEVHLLLEPAPAGSGISITANLPVDTLGKNWQRQVVADLQVKTHRGVLVGAPLTDVHITLVNGRASNVHTVGGDFREATWRAVRQGLMMLRQRGGCQLLEPWYAFRLVVEQSQVGRAMTDIQAMAGKVEAPQLLDGGRTLLVGSAPVSAMRDYPQTVHTYTHGQGQLELVVAGYHPVADQAPVVERSGYVPTADLANTPDSVFCAHGAGYPVAWAQVPAAAHLAYQPNFTED